MQKNSIFKKLILNNMKLTIIILLLCVVGGCVLVVSRYVSDAEQNNEKILHEYTQYLSMEIENGIDSSNQILKSEYFSNAEGISKYNNCERLEYADNVRKYIDNITSGGENAQIFSSNTDIYESKYIQKISNLNNYEGLCYDFKTKNLDLIWDDQLHVDERGRQYFVFYRYMKLYSDSILAYKIILPATSYSSILILDSKNDSVYKLSEKLANGFRIAFVPETGSGHIIALIIAVFLFFGAALVMAFVHITNLSSKKITADIDHFIESITDKNIMEAKLDLSANIEDYDELRIIKNAVSSLIVKVKEISMSQLQAEIEKKNLKFSLLQSRIEPHTLYNSLSAIRLKADIAKNDETVKLVDNMVSYYRAALSKGKEYVTIEQEIDMLRSYVAIAELSQNKTYKFSAIVDENVKGIMIVHMFLQPFVENSIVHGLSGSRKNCAINIECASDGKYMEIVVCDNGYGIGGEKLKRLNNLEMYEDSYGIKNTFLRMKLVYGEDSSIKYYSKENEGTRVIIRFRKKN